MNDLQPELRGSRRRRAFLPVFLAAAVAAACTQQVQRGDGLAAVGPMLSVERFLQASNARDFDAMSRLFGTPEGPVAEEGGGFGCFLKGVFGSGCARREDVELRMAAIADILQHEDYRIVSERMEPGRAHPTNRIGVDFTKQGRVVRDVPFLVVRTGGGRWLVQEIDLQKLTSD